MRRVGILVVLLSTVLLFVGCGKQSVAFDSQNETAIFLREVSKGRTLEQPQDPQLDGHIFLGWYTDIEGGEKWNFSKPVDRDMNLYARWQPISLSITFHLDPAGQHIVKQDVYYGSEAEVPQLTEVTGYRFAGWATDLDGDDPWHPMNRVYEDSVIYAQWEAIQYQLFYHVDEEVPYAGDRSEEYGYGESVSVSSGPERDGFVFTGWNTLEDGTGTTYLPQERFEMPAEPVHLFPQWSLPVQTLAAGSTHSLMLLDDGKLLAVGYNAQGQLGDGSRTSKTSPVTVHESVRSVSAGAGYSYFIDNDGQLWGMGDNYFGQLGDSQRLQPKVNPVVIMDKVVDVSAGNGHALVLREDGSLWAMGNNEDGQLGDGTDTNRFAPVRIADNVQAVSAGAYHSLFIRTDGTLWAMGWNADGQLGDGTTQSRRRPVHITDDVVQVSAGNKHSLFMKSDGTVWAMGDDTGGQLATGEPKAHATFVQVATGATTIETGDDHSLYIDTDGVLWGTGSNTAGQLDRALPGMITEWRPLRESVSMVSAGRDFTLFIQSDLLGATGSNEYGQIASWGE